jgi:hypothetical protein
MSLWVDGALRFENAYIGEFEEGDYAGLEALFPWPGLKYLDNVEWQLIEGDTGPDDPSPVVTIGPLLVADSKDEHSVEFEDGTTGSPSTAGTGYTSPDSDPSKSAQSRRRVCPSRRQRRLYFSVTGTGDPGGRGSG